MRKITLEIMDEIRDIQDYIRVDINKGAVFFDVIPSISGEYTLAYEIDQNLTNELNTLIEEIEGRE